MPLIPFYRKIRKNLSDEHRFFQYSRYALGEIILVVVGILIALQINNWNEDRKSRKIEVKLLKELHNDLEVTLEEIEGDIPNLKSQMNVADHLIRFANDPKNIHVSAEQFIDTFGYFYWNVKMYPRTIAYQNLRSMGFDLFSNDSIRYLTADMFDRRLLRVAYWENRVYQKQERLIEKMSDHFISCKYKVSQTSSGLDNMYLYAPKDFQDLSNNVSILNELANMQNDRQMQLRLYMELRGFILQLIHMIEEEIGENISAATD